MLARDIVVSAYFEVLFANYFYSLIAAHKLIIYSIDIIVKCGLFKVFLHAKECTFFLAGD